MLDDVQRRFRCERHHHLEPRVQSDAGGAKKAAEKGPVVITDRGRPAHVLLRFEDYQKLLGAGPSLLEVLTMPGGEDIELDPPKLQLVTKPAELD